MRFLNFSDTRHEGCVRPQIGNSEAHELMKFKKACALKRMGHPFVCEARSKDGKFKFDIIDLWEGVAYEFETNPDPAAVIKKKEKYLDCPYVVNIIDVKTGNSQELSELVRTHRYLIK